MTLEGGHGDYHDGGLFKNPLQGLWEYTGFGVSGFSVFKTSGLFRAKREVEEVALTGLCGECFDLT